MKTWNASVTLPCYYVWNAVKKNYTSNITNTPFTQAVGLKSILNGSSYFKFLTFFIGYHKWFNITLLVKTGIGDEKVFNRSQKTLHMLLVGDKEIAYLLAQVVVGSLNKIMYKWWEPIDFLQLNAWQHGRWKTNSAV